MGTSKRGTNDRIQWDRLGRRLFLAGMVLSATGCNQLFHRDGNSEASFWEAPSLLPSNKDKATSETRYVGDLCRMYGLSFSKVHGIGLAVDLNGTGSAPMESGQRDHLERELKLQSQYDDVEAMLSSKNTELVIMQGKLPPGIQAGETFDLEVVTMSDSDATTLEHGMILPARLRPMARLGRGVKQGNVVGMAKGRILINALFESRQDKGNQLHGVVLGGGKALEDRPLGLKIQSEDYDQKTSTQIAQAINGRFTRNSKVGRDDVAEPKTDRLVEFIVPENYKHNIGRFASVVNQLAIAEPGSARLARLETLKSELQQPSRTALAALRLEALGKDGIPVLKQALSSTNDEVRFYAAEALAYSGQTDGIEVLKDAAKSKPTQRWHALTALTSLGDSASTAALIELLEGPGAETRYGAFRALLDQAPGEPICKGSWLADDFFLHRVPGSGQPLIHFSREKRPEIVVFGDEQAFGDNFIFVQPGLTVRTNDNKTITIKRFSTEFGTQQRTCSNRVADVIEALGEIGFGYSQQLTMLREAKESNMLKSRLAINAVPQLNQRLMTVDAESEEAEADSNSVWPNLFGKSGSGSSDGQMATGPAVGSGVAQSSADKDASGLDRFKRWITGSADSE